MAGKNNGNTVQVFLTYPGGQRMTFLMMKYIFLFLQSLSAVPSKAFF